MDYPGHVSWLEFKYCYLNDIHFDFHRTTPKTPFTALEAIQGISVFINAEKCSLVQLKVTFLGHDCSRFLPEAATIQALLDALLARTLRHLQSFEIVKYSYLLHTTHLANSNTN